MKSDVQKLLEAVRDKKIDIDEAMLELRKKPFEDIEHAKVDLHRNLRQGASEVIYGEGKTSEQIVDILKTMKENGEDNILITRLSEDKADEVFNHFDINYNKIARVGILGKMPKHSGIGKIVVASGGTSDMPVAEEAALTAEFLGNEVVRLYDVGVAGIHRMFANIDDIMQASVIIAVAGMEGALASVVGGVANCPVIAVPTSVGYGASFNGLAALLAMLNSCASGVSVVNIDNGFGAGYLASMINQMEAKNENNLL